MMKLTLMGCTLTVGAMALAFALNAATELDADGDGMYSLPELQAGYPEMTAEDFALVDANGDGLVDPDELASAQNAGVLPLLG
jgi:opacity protein-like surface antigen